jgi:hypothetical protein
LSVVVASGFSHLDAAERAEVKQMAGVQSDLQLEKVVS